MKAISYSEKLQNPRWNEKRLSILKRDGYKCRMCGADNAKINVHHIVYLKDRDPWDYPDSLLISVCDSCHTKEHLYEKLPLAEKILETLVEVTNLPLSNIEYIYYFLPQWLIRDRKPG
jgi:5-methylcytosine-specific restriction endonuclease McrA